MRKNAMMEVAIIWWGVRDQPDSLIGHHADTFKEPLGVAHGSSCPLRLSSAVRGAGTQAIGGSQGDGYTYRDGVE
jgi:hypothetical protein